MNEEISKEDTNEKVSNMNEEKSKSSAYNWIVPVIAAALVLLAAFYLFTPETRTVSVSVPYQEAVYSTFYYGTLKDTGMSTLSWTVTRATSYDKEYTGKDFWGTPEYTFKICSDSQCTNYPEINAWSLTPSTELTGYETKYRTEYKDITKTRLEWLI